MTDRASAADSLDVVSIGEALSGWQPTLGAVLREEGVFFRVWAPDRQQVDVVIFGDDQEPTAHPLVSEPAGYWSGLIADAGAGVSYMFRLDDEKDRPDPASRSQPAGVHGPSLVVDPAFSWTDQDWRGVAREDMIIYEMHVGAATEQGTFDSLSEKLPILRELGVTAIEIMPVADFPGNHNWGYDGVDLFAPARAYGGVDAFKRFVDAAHEIGLAVLLDVVYNHFGPSGNYLRDYTSQYFTHRHHTPWGDAVNFDDEGSRAVRDFCVENALYWTHEYHIDGLRLDATQEIIDSSPEHILAEIVRRVRASLPAERHFTIYAEDSRNKASLARPHAAGGDGFDGIWTDDFHHIVRVTLTGEQESYFAAYRGGGEELAAALRGGWLFSGQQKTTTNSAWGTSGADLPPAAFVWCIQTHDHVGNRAMGDRLNQYVTPAEYRAASVLALLAPYTPLLFMGQEWAASTPFMFFTDHDADLGPLISEGRRKEYEKFVAFQGADLPDPQEPATFTGSKLKWSERAEPEHAASLQLYKDLIALRRSDPAYLGQDRTNIEASSAGPKAVTLLLKSSQHTLLILASLGETALVDLDEVAGGALTWEALLDSEDPNYGGTAGPLELSGKIKLNGARAVALRGSAPKPSE